MLPYMLLLWVAMPYGVFGQRVTAYESCAMICTLAVQAKPLIAIRSFRVKSERFFLLVDPLKLTTSIHKASEVKPCPTSWIELKRQYFPDPYIKALIDAETTSTALQDAGITHMTTRARGIDLTADLCPSKHDLDRGFFQELIEILRKYESPVPLALAVSGLWIEEHPQDFYWLKNLVDSGFIVITWINHSFHHPTGKDSDISRDFLLKKGTRIDEEILKTEKLLIEYGALPSVFFRFPGLVSNDSLFKTVVSYGLIPVGSDAWLAKNQRPTDGSIVLVHANGNEPAGIQRFLKLLHNEKSNIDKKQWLLFDLKESVVETVKEPYIEPQGEIPSRDVFVIQSGHSGRGSPVRSRVY